MQKWIGAGVLVAVAGAGLAWQQGWLGGAGSEPLTAYVPADTVLYIGGQADANQLEHIRKLPLMANSQFQAKQLLTELERSNRRQTPQSQFAIALFADFISNANTYGDMVEHYGLDLTKPQAIYMDGMVPVIRFGLKDEATFWQVLDKASAESGLQPREVTVGSTPTKLWRLSPEDDKALELAVNVRDGVATITAFHFLDQDADQQQRLALTKPAQSLADSGELEQLQKTYKFDESMLALVHFQRLAQGFLQPESNGFGQDLSALFKAQDERLPAEEMDAACRTEVLDMIGQMPRLVAGNTNSSSGKVLKMHSRSVLEINNAEVVGALSSLRGHVPGHTGHSDGQIIGVGAGLDIDNLVPAATTLFNKMTATESSCRQIRRMQRDMNGANPAMMAMFTGMVQGAKGLGFSLYDLKLDGNSPMPTSYDFLFSIATSNPQPLLGMLAMSPMGRQIQIPTDGSLTDVDLSFIAPGMSIKAGIQGNHLVAFSGDKAQQAVDKLKDESLEANGLMRVSADYGRFADLIDAIPPMFASEMNTGMSESGCVAQAQLSHMLRTQGASVDYTLDIIDQGVSTDISLQMDTTAVKAVNPVGRYTLMDQTYDCAVGEAQGTEEIRADKTGTYTFTHEGCDLYRTEYTWSQEGNLFSITPSKIESRDICDAEWKQEELISSQCILLPAEEGFRCIYSDEERENLFHYVPRS
ncbi:hypothetical protein GCM10009104_25200 [Marinobacterium maritimum]|uniref:Uncharacterized protein n=1 Tax=Marinobacterium maritimum TaxID=500162 RepID=A0ABN1I820_9GAMM